MEEIFSQKHPYHDVLKSIDNSDIPLIQKLLQYNLNIITSDIHSDEIGFWNEFRYRLLQYEFEWQLNVFQWGLQFKNGVCRFTLDIDWHVLNNKPANYFLVYQALESTWLGHNTLFNFWNLAFLIK